ncbi:MAG: sulfatase-like hydrolase/transferase, partial [Myxococcales bacterium]|nr:sulfatase-like hydrolase/transferase [Myxococcales bacterium]
LRRLGRYDDTLVIVTSDHGEEFRDHGWLGHTRTLYQELVRVPLIVSAPGHRARPRVVEEPVSLVSITPTVLDLLGIDAPGLPFHEPSLASRIRGKSARASDFVLTEVGFLPPNAPSSVKRAFKKGIVGERFKLIRDEETHAIEVYDLESDPGETRNLAEERPELRDRLLGALEDRLRRAREAATEPDLRHLTKEEIETLRGLGYVGS